MDQNALLITSIVAVVLGGAGLIGGVLGYVQSTAAVRRSTHARQRAVTAEEEALRARAAAEATLRSAEELAERFRAAGARTQTGSVGTGRVPTAPAVRWDERAVTGQAPMAEPTTGATLLPDTGPLPVVPPVGRRPAEQVSPPVSVPVPVQSAPEPGPRPEPPAASASSQGEGQHGSADAGGEPGPADPGGVGPARESESPSAPTSEAEPEPEPEPAPEAAPVAGSAPLPEPAAADPRFVVQASQVEGAGTSVEPSPAPAAPDEPVTVADASVPVDDSPAPSPAPAADEPQPEEATPDEEPADGRDATGRVTAGAQDAPTMDWAEVLRTGAIPLPSISRGTYAAPRRRPKPTGEGPARFELRAIGRQRYEALNVGAESALDARIVGVGDDPHLVRPLSSRPATVAPGGTLAFSVLRVEGREVSVQVVHLVAGEPVHQDLPLD